MADKYISIPIEIEALQFTPLTLGEIPVFTKCSNFQFSLKDNKYNCVITVDAIKLLVIEDDFIINDKGKISVMKPNEFNSKYIKKE